MTGYVIEKGVPLPDPGSRHVGKPFAYGSLPQTFKLMEAGDSIVTKATLQAISAAAIVSGAHVTSRKEGAGYRVWRTA